MIDLDSLWQCYVPKPWWDEAELLVNDIQHETTNTHTTVALSRRGNHYGNTIGKVGEIACGHMLDQQRIEHALLAREIKTARIKSDFADIILSGLKVDVITGETGTKQLRRAFSLLVPKHKIRKFDLYMSMAYCRDNNKIFFMGWLPGQQVWDAGITASGRSGGPAWLRYPARVIPAEDLLSIESLKSSSFVRC